MMKNLEINLGKLRLKNPVMVASGTFGYAQEFRGYMDVGKLGAVVTKTITLKPRKGNPMPRTCETPAGMLNSVGLENPGLDAFIKDKLPYLKKLRAPLAVSIASEDDPGEFIILTKKLNRINCVRAIEMNVSCPNISLKFKVQGSKVRNKKFGLIAQDAVKTFEIVKAVRKHTDKTLIVKLSPNVTDITEIAAAAETAGADALALINTLQAMSINVQTGRAKIAMGVAGLSGPAIRPVAVRMVWEAYQKIKIPIIGMGGIIDTPSALEFIYAGATAIAVGTGNFIKPSLSLEIIDGIKKHVVEKKLTSIKEIIGKVKI